MIRAFLLLLLIGSIFVDYRIADLKAFEDEMIKVSVIGEVEKQGVVYISKYSTVNDLFDKVKLTKDADISTINLNMTLKDKDVINVLALSDRELISLNNATVEQLDSLPGIGVSTAEKIVEYRLKHGLFQSVEDVMLVDGIKQAKYEQIKEYLCI